MPTNTCRIRRRRSYLFTAGGWLRAASSPMGADARIARRRPWTSTRTRKRNRAQMCPARRVATAMLESPRSRERVIRLPRSRFCPRIIAVSARCAQRRVVASSLLPHPSIRAQGMPHSFRVERRWRGPPRRDSGERIARASTTRVFEGLSSRTSCGFDTAGRFHCSLVFERRLGTGAERHGRRRDAEQLRPFLAGRR